MAPGPGLNGGTAGETRIGWAASPSGSSGLESETDASALFVEELRRFLIKEEGSALKAWLKHFDLNNDQKISKTEFERGMRRLSYAGDVTRMFSFLDADRSGELSLDEVDADNAALWCHFRRWCVESFEGVQDMVRHLMVVIRSNRMSTGFKFREAMEDRIELNQITMGLQEAGWQGGQEDLLFNALDVEDRNYLTAAQLRWLEIEKRRQRRKEQAKKRASCEMVKRGKTSREAENSKAALADVEFLNDWSMNDLTTRSIRMRSPLKT